jgi:hypothetical protein
MRTLLRFAFGFLVIGAVALVGSALFEAPAGRAYGSASGGDLLLKFASARIDSAISQASFELGPALGSISIRSRSFARSNALEARMEFRSLASSLSTGGRLHGHMPYWMKSGVQGTTEASGQKAMAMANGMPMVQAVKSNIRRLADAHPTLSAASSF